MTADQNATRRALETLNERLIDGLGLRPEDVAALECPRVLALGDIGRDLLTHLLHGLQPGVDGLAAMVGNDDMILSMLERGLAEQRSVVAELFEAVASAAAFPEAVRAAMGLHTEVHEQVLRDAVAEGRFTEADALASYGHGAEIVRRLGGAARMPLPSFATWDDYWLRRQYDQSIVKIEAPRRIQTRHGPVSYVTTNAIEATRVAELLDREPTTIEWLDGTMDEGTVFFDVGANTGLYSLYAARVHPSVRVVAFEPHPMNFARLNRNIELNDTGARVLAFPVALSDANGFARFEILDQAPGAVGPGAERGMKADRFVDGKVHVLGATLVTLDEFVARADGLPHPTHLKVDVDGPELRVLQGAPRTLASKALRHVLVELASDAEEREVDALLHANGFRMGARSADNTGFGQRVWARE